MNKLEENKKEYREPTHETPKVNRISIGTIANCLLAISWLVIEFIDYANTEEKLQVGTIMWVSLSIYILIGKLGGTRND